jgi:hypothetical protein
MLAGVSDAPSNSEAKSEAPKPVRAPAGAGRSGPVKNPWPFVLLVLGLCVAGWFLASWMQQSSQIQDCVMSGRKNCGTPIDPKLGR